MKKSFSKVFLILLVALLAFLTIQEAFAAYQIDIVYFMVIVTVFGVIAAFLNKSETSLYTLYPTAKIYLVSAIAAVVAGALVWYKFRLFGKAAFFTALLAGGAILLLSKLVAAKEYSLE